MYLPAILKAKVNREIIIDNYTGILLEQISPLGLFDIEYHYLFVLYDYNLDPYPLICFSSEWANKEPETKDEPFLCAFIEDHSFDNIVDSSNGHVNFGHNRHCKDIEFFLNESLKIFKKQFEISEKIKINTVEPSSTNIEIGNKNIRTKEQIINQFKVSEKYFEIIYSSYEKVFTDMNYDLYIPNQNVGLWNDDHEYFNDINNFSADEILLAKYDIYQAILNRVVVRFITDGEDATRSMNAFYNKKWWQFWK